jgi:hypothetical protein
MRSRIALLTAAVIGACGLGAAAETTSALRGGFGSGVMDRTSLRILVHQVSEEHGLDPDLVDAVVRVESGYNPRAVSRKGAMGLMQLMPATAKRLNVRNPFDPEQNVRGGVREFSRLVRRFHGNLPLALAAYNAGENAVARYRGIPPYRETRNYVSRIMSIYTGRPYVPGRSRRAPQVRLLRDPGSGQPVITNRGPGSGEATVPPAAARVAGDLLGGGFGS